MTTVEHLSVVVTTETGDDVTGTTTDSGTVTLSSLRGFDVYLQCMVVVIGVVGTAANALVLYALVASKQHRNQVLIFNQNAIDCFSSLFLVITYVVKLCNIYLTGSAGYWLCMLILSENIIWVAICASKANLIFVTFERYLKAVYPIWSKKRLRRSVLYSSVLFAWFSGFAHVFILTFFTSDVIDGVCYSYVFFDAPRSQLAYGIWFFLTYYAVEIVIFIYCYWHILVAIRRQARVMAVHGSSASGTAQARSHQIQTNVVKTMILVSVCLTLKTVILVSGCYALSDLPMNIFLLIMNIYSNLTLLDNSYYAAMFVSYLYFCTNPFIYATKFDPVKRVLLGLIPCKKTSVQQIQSIAMTAC